MNNQCITGIPPAGRGNLSGFFAHLTPHFCPKLQLANISKVTQATNPTHTLTVATMHKEHQ
jgi:hypothetical protein